MTKEVTKKEPIKPTRVSQLMILVSSVARKLESLAEAERAFVLVTLNNLYAVNYGLDVQLAESGEEPAK